MTISTLVFAAPRGAVTLAVTGPGDFERAVLVLGALLVIDALALGLAHRSALSLTAVFVVAGFALGVGGVGVLHFDPRSRFVAELAEVALIVILFRDGLEVEGEMLQRAWHLPLRKLVLAMPLTAALVALCARVLVGLSWTESFLLGALLSPTDPVLSSAVVTNPRVPRLIRHSLNLESGLNDGLALPAVLALAAALGGSGSHFVWWQFVLRDVGLGAVYGIAFGLVAGWLLPRGRGLRERMPEYAHALFAFGVAFACFGTASLGRGNGFIAVFVCAITLGVRRPELRAHVETGARELVEVVKLGIFVVFGSLLTLHGLFTDGAAAVAVVAFTLLIARPVAVTTALLGSKTDKATVAFMSWFGPKGVATMTFSLIVLGDNIKAGTRIFNLAALTVFCSVIAHGLTDTAGVNWIANRVKPD